MKRTLSFFLSALLCISLFVFAALPASAASMDLYVKEGGTGDGSSPDKALPTFDEAYRAAAELSDDVTIHIIDLVSFDLVAFGEFPTHTNAITVTGDILDLTSTNNIFWSLGGEMIFENIELFLSARLLIRTNFHPLTFGEGVSLPSGQLITVCVTSRQTLDDFDGDNVCKKDAVVTLLSGDFNDVSVYRDNDNGKHIDGTVVFNVGGTATVNNLVVARNAYSTVKNVEFHISGGQINRFVGNCDLKNEKMQELDEIPGVTEKLTCSFSNGFLLENSFNLENTTTFFGISGPSVIVDAAMFLEKIEAKFELQISENLYNDFVAAPDKVQLSSFDSVIKTTSTADPAATTDTASVTTAETNPAPVTTEAPEGGEPTPATGDYSAILIIVSLASLAMVLILSGKKAHN